MTARTTTWPVFAALAGLMVLFSATSAPADATDMDGLKDMLDAFADEIHDNKDADGEVVSYDCLIKRETWTFVITCWAGDSEIVMLARLREVPDPIAAPGPVLLKLLQANDVIHPIAFTYNERNKNIYLFCTIPNDDLRTRDIGKRLNLMTNSIEKYEPLWNPEKW